ncbi:MAG TPA: hypothetical protein VMK12_07025 [Anaeromyxobacteraceae bacterium]|nr:hypothetical protein [Anaeromyxobacteraceae bacterium]
MGVHSSATTTPTALPPDWQTMDPVQKAMWVSKYNNDVQQEASFTPEQAEQADVGQRYGAGAQPLAVANAAKSGLTPVQALQKQQAIAQQYNQGMQGILARYANGTGPMPGAPDAMDDAVRQAGVMGRLQGLMSTSRSASFLTGQSASSTILGGGK